jgi:hypothetical protein
MTNQEEVPLFMQFADLTRTRTVYFVFILCRREEFVIPTEEWLSGKLTTME